MLIMSIKRICLLFFTIFIIFVLLSFKAEASPIYEDFTTYTEVDTANDRIQRNATHVDHAATRNEDTYLYKDYGVNHFTDFEHLVDIRSDFASASGIGVVWMLSNELDDWHGLYDADKTILSVRFWAGTPSICLEEAYAGVGYADTYTCLADTWYYLTINKSGTNFTCKIYSDSARTNLLDTLSLTLQADHSLRYIHACNVRNNSASAYLINVDIGNLDLQEAIENSVTLNSPSNGATETTWTVNFNYTPVFYNGTIQNSSLWLNLSGTWQRVQWNTTAVTNNTQGTMSYTFSTEGVYMWNVEVFNSTHSFFASSNWTLTIDLTSPTYSKNTTNITEASEFCEFKLEADDNIALHNNGGYIFSTNNSGSWQNVSFTSFTATPQNMTNTTILNSTVGTIVAWCYYFNDSANNWNGTSCEEGNLFYLTTTSPNPNYQNAGSNATSIQPNGTILFYGQGYDGIGLDWAILSTNETGNWRNYTDFDSTLFHKRDAPVISGNSTTGGIGVPSVVKNGTDYIIYTQKFYAKSSNETDFGSWYSTTFNETVASNFHGCAYKDAGVFRMIGHNNSNTDFVLATSNNGVDFDVHGVVLSIGSPGEFDDTYIWDPWEMKIGDTYYLFYTAVPGFGQPFDIGLATSSTGQPGSYTKQGIVLSDSASGWDSWGVADPLIINYTNNQYALWYAGVSGIQTGPHAIGYAVNASADLTSWTKHSGNPIITQTESWEKSNWVHEMSVLIEDNKYKVWYTTRGSTYYDFGYTWSYMNSSGLPAEEGALYYDSPLDMNNVADAWTWSNFTWSNSSITGGTTIGWRIYYNDTSGNVNKTDIMTFTVKKSDGSSCSASIECLGGYCVHNICRSTSTFCGDAYCDVGESCFNCVSDCGVCLGDGGFPPTIITTTKGEATITIPSIAADKMATVSIEKTEDIAIREIIISVVNSVNNIKLIIRKLPSRPAIITKEIIGNVYHYMNLTKERITDADISTVKIRFAVDKSWISDNNINISTISLNRWYNEQWSRLITSKISETVDEIIFEAESSGLSYFAINGEMPQCSVCPEPTEWSDCIDNKQIRTSYRCSKETSYICKSYVETRDCEVKKEEVKFWIDIFYEYWYVLVIVAITIFILFSRGILKIK